MYRAGRPCEIVKADWDIANKHVSVRCADHHLQVVEFCCRFFIKRCLTFGGGNSPTLYHMQPSMLITMAEIQSGFDPLLNLMQLDDNCTVDMSSSARLRAYKRAYRELAVELGVRLGGEDNPSKAFPPSSKGIILGLIYDGQAWTWEMPKDKSDRMFVLLAKGIKQGNLRNEEAMTLAEN